MKNRATIFRYIEKSPYIVWFCRWLSYHILLIYNSYLWSKVFTLETWNVQQNMYYTGKDIIYTSSYFFCCSFLIFLFLFQTELNIVYFVYVMLVFQAADSNTLQMYISLETSRYNLYKYIVLLWDLSYNPKGMTKR